MINIMAIMALGMAITPVIGDRLRIPKKLRAFLTVALITGLNMANVWIYGDGNLLAASRDGIEAGLMAVGLYSTSKNAMQLAQDHQTK